MSDIPRPDSRRHRDTEGLDLEKMGLDPLHMEPPTATSGLRPLGQVDGLQEIQPTTAILPTGEPAGKEPESARARARRMATALDWSETGGGDRR